MAVTYVVRKEGELWSVRKRANWFQRYFGLAEWDMRTVHQWQFESWADAFEDAFWWCEQQRNNRTDMMPIHYYEGYMRSMVQLPQG
ncbi:MULTISPECIES: hypothetical protein [Rhodococcus]|uniref:hypothetical protein n=1 Tax=Rhodococcus TaxID=1827 RepID=UPI0007AE5E5D|nr:MULTISPECIES: hypothetical protein [Rhodococcus]KZL33203.1 hypothetical protein A3852_12975 [Rhodococcus qingshengii]MCE4161637.1 hypothetical protein [Rhodococcus sp. Ni2]